MSCKGHVEKIIGSMHTNKTCGPSSIPTKILKNELAKPLSNIINISFSTGKFPNSWKKVEIVPLYKKDEKLDCNNCRPISLLARNIFEKIIH